MKKVILGASMILAGVISVAVILAGSMAGEWTVNGKMSSIWNLQQYGLISALCCFVGIAIVGFALSLWGVFEKRD